VDKDNTDLEDFEKGMKRIIENNKSIDKSVDFITNFFPHDPKAGRETHFRNGMKLGLIFASIILKEE